MRITRLSTSSKRRMNVAFAVKCLSLSAAIAACSSRGIIAASTWLPPSGDWSLSTNWDTDPTIPDGAGAIAQYTGAVASTVTVDSARTVGTLNLGGSSEVSWGVLANAALTFDQDGGGAGFATISNSNTSASSQLTLPTLGTGGSYVLADDLHIINSSNSGGTSAIALQGILSGAGNLTFRNESTSLTGNFIRMIGANTFVGNSLIQKGVTAFSNSTAAFGPAASNTITLGDASDGGQGSATLLGITAVTLPNPINVASGSGGTLSLGFNFNSSTAHGYSGLITLNDNLNLVSNDAGTNNVLISSKVTGTGSLTMVGPGNVRLTSTTSDFSGGTTLTSGTLILGANSTPASGAVTSGPLGTGALTLNGGILTWNGGTTVGSVIVTNIANPIVANASTITKLNGSVSNRGLILNGAITGTGTIQVNTPAFSGNTLYIQGDISNFQGTFDFSSDVSNSTVLAFTGGATMVADGSKAKFVVNNNGGNRALRFGLTPGVTGGVASTDATLKIGELSGTTAAGNIIGDATNSNNLEVGALNTDSSYAGYLRSGIALRKMGTGSLTLTNTTVSNTYAKGTTVSAGTLIAGGDAAPTGGVFGIPAVTPTDFTTIQLNDNAADGTSSTNANVGLLTGGAFTISLPVKVNNFGTGVTTIGGNTNDNSTFSGAITLDKSANLTSQAIGGNTLTVSGIVSGAGGLTKVGPGRATLSNTNAYIGPTNVNQGELLVTGSLATGSAVTVSGGALLGGNGTIGGSVQLQTSGQISPGNSAGTLTVGGLASTGGVYHWQLGALQDQGTGVAGTDFDQIVVNAGDLSLNAASSVALDFSLLAANLQPSHPTLDPFWNASHSWKIIDITGSATNLSGINFGSITGQAGPGTWGVTLNAGDVLLNYTLAALLTGDVNGDNIVNQLDLNVVFGNWLSTGASLAQGDANTDGVVNQLDINTITGNWLATGPVGGLSSATVPEPASWLLGAFAAMGLAAARKRRLR